MKKLLFFTFLIGSLASTSRAEIIDKIVAVVNDEPITQSELDTNFAPVFQQFVRSYKGIELNRKLEEARTNVLHQLIEDRLVYQEAKRQKVPVAPEEIDQKLEELKASFTSEEEFRTKLIEQGLTLKALRQRFEEQISIMKIHQYEILSRVLVSPLDIEDYYIEHLGEFTQSERAKVRTLVLRKKPEEEALDDTRARLEAFVLQIKAGASFQVIAENQSEESHAEEGGNLGFVGRGEMIEKIDDVIFKSSVGEITEIVETEIGFHVFLVEVKQEQKVPSLEDKYDEVRGIIFRERADARMKAWIEELKENAYISLK